MNPLIKRGIRERLRTKQLVASGLFSLILTTTLYLSAYLNGMQEKTVFDYETGSARLIPENPTNGARNAFTLLLGFQGFVLMFLGTGRVASITAEERESGLLDYQRMTPMHPFSKIGGYLFGLPAREYFMFLLTIPFLIHCVIVGKLPWPNIIHLYSVFFCSVIFYHLTAHVIGLVVPRPRTASWVSRIAVLGLYIFLPVLGQAGISFLSFLTILPTYFGKILPSLLFIGESKLGRFETKAAEFWQDVPFFNSTISPSAFTFFMQGLIILTLVITAYRKWRNEALPAFSKPSGLILYTIFQFLLLGSLWTFFFDGKANGLLGETFSTNMVSSIGKLEIAIVIVQSIYFALSFLAILALVNICCPNLHLYLKGLQRSEKLELQKIPLAADEGSGFWFVGLLSLITAAVHAVFISLANSSEVWNLQSTILSTISFPFLVVLSSSLYLQASREQWFNLGFWGFVGLVWITPLLAGLVVMVGWKNEYLNSIFKLLALNPISWIPLHLLSENSNALAIPEEVIGDLVEGVWFGVAIALSLAIILQFRLYLKRNRWNGSMKT
tara:strand:- start:70 stop:1737 length:1668 start_codon:yes stop_codon:yes gene_type:complete